MNLTKPGHCPACGCAFIVRPRHAAHGQPWADLRAFLAPPHHRHNHGIRNSGTFTPLRIGDHQSRTRGKLACYAQAPNHADSAGCSVRRRRLARPRPCSRGRGHIGRKGLSGRVCTGLRRNAALACGRSGQSNDPANLRRAAKTHPHLARLRGRRDKADQEFVLRWSPDGGHSFREIVRQQWNFSPPDTTREVEEYQVELFRMSAHLN